MHPSQNTERGERADLDNHRNAAPHRKNRECCFEVLVEEVEAPFAIPSSLWPLPVACFRIEHNTGNALDPAVHR